MSISQNSEELLEMLKSYKIDDSKNDNILKRKKLS